MSELIDVPLSSGAVITVDVEADRVPGGDDLTWASRPDGSGVRRASQTLGGMLQHLGPLVSELHQAVGSAAPRNTELEFGVTLGGETGFFLAKGTAEVHLRVTLKWGGFDE
jgi:hypothetical protein